MVQFGLKYFYLYLLIEGMYLSLGKFSHKTGNMMLLLFVRLQTITDKLYCLVTQRHMCVNNLPRVVA